MQKIAIFLSPFILIGMVFLVTPHAFADNNLNLNESGIYNPNTGDINYTLNWNLTDSTALSNLNIGNNVPLGTTFISAAQGGSLLSNNIHWSLGPQNGPVASSVNFTVSVDAAQALNPRTPPLYPFSCGLISTASATGTLVNSTNSITATTTDRIDLVPGCGYGGSGSGGSGISGVSGISGIVGGVSGGPGGSGSPGGNTGGGGTGGTSTTTEPNGGSGSSGGGNPGGSSVGSLAPQILGASTTPSTSPAVAGTSVTLPRTGLPEWLLIVLVMLSASLTFIYRKAYG